ncbi:COA6 [Bugula neritina]|uniref:COA6 n=1 Tax=Bugula neritina TaxID=10212 RepID=A0A7J7JL73_BUGNE|nr:COA6 [Bugula neritina]KAF6026103.1 COA6 [Bugula neritina]KAF6026108.1 COA6 [Bugula neritina]
MPGVVPDQAPSKLEREVCWHARDKYWECLDAAGSPVVNKTLCVELRKVFESNCSNTWVKHFDRRFGYTRFQKSQPTEINLATTQAK